MTEFYCVFVRYRGPGWCYEFGSHDRDAAHAQRAHWIAGNDTTSRDCVIATLYDDEPTINEYARKINHSGA